MMRTLFTKEFPSTVEAVGQVMGEALEVMTQHNLCCPESSFSVRLCLEEALVNAVRHGNKGVAEHKIHLDILEDGDCCCIRVRDEGGGFDPEAVTMPGCEELGGRGVCLIKHFMDDVRFNAEENCLEMEFRRKIKAAK